MPSEKAAIRACVNLPLKPALTSIGLGRIEDHIQRPRIQNVIRPLVQLILGGVPQFQENVIYQRHQVIKPDR